MAADVVVKTMGPLFTLAEVKAHLRVEHSADDAIITAYMDAAVGRILMYCNTAIVPIGHEAEFKAAGLLAVGALYENRADGGDLPIGAQRLIDPYRNLRV
ncbi:head-tail connector protein [Methylobacterium sp. E-045]|uniref:head-tail connector protein n=1 Tax=Methylobacterium sp. E-045 TaxID=2836575 RepID=UPI001FBAEE95|nr:head-tail connector protein [Methylobacterium sp. E-045]MCJ2132456.1 head-tail connector protein [Methylobacterium sp. E-045]